VSVVDDDESVRESLPDLLRQCGFAAQAFSSAEAFLASEALGQTRCLILDIAMPGMSGPDLQQELIRRCLISVAMMDRVGRGDEARSVVDQSSQLLEFRHLAWRFVGERAREWISSDQAWRFLLSRTRCDVEKGREIVE
jgi:DNA-binding NtrC family response regulator